MYETLINGGFLEVYYNYSLIVCESRDQKEIYQKSRKKCYSLADTLSSYENS